MRAGTSGEFADVEVRRFIDEQPPQLGYDELAALTAEHFGAERAWSPDRIRRYWLAHRRRDRGGVSTVEENPAVRAFLLDRAGRLTIKQLQAACAERFGEDAPSRSAIGRFVSKAVKAAADGREVL